MRNRLRRLFASPIFDNEEKTRAARFLNLFAWIAIVILLVVWVIRIVLWGEEIGFSLTVIAGLICILVAVQFIIRLGYVRYAGVFLITSTWMAVAYQAWETDGLRDVSVIGFLIITLLASLLLGWRGTFTFGIMSIASVWYLAVLEEQGVRLLHVDEPFSYARDVTVIFFLAGTLFYLLINNLNRSLSDARLELKERLRAEERLQRQADYLTALNETALGLLNRSELQPLLESILARACDLLDTQHGWISLKVPDGSAMQQVAGQGLLSKYNRVHMFKKNEGVTGSVWSSGQTQVIYNYRTWDKSLPQFLDVGFNVVMGVPLKVGDTVIGVIGISYVEQERRFTQEQIELMERFAALASLAIENARLYEQAKSELNERKMVEVKLRASEERFRKVFQASPVAIRITTLEEGRLLDGNDAYWKISGNNAQESIGHTIEELGMQDATGDRRDFVEKIKIKHSMINPNYEFLTYDKKELRFVIAFHELIEIKDQTCILSMFYDITEQKQAQEALRDAEARTHALLTAIPDMIFEISKDGLFKGYIPSSEIRPLVAPEQFLGKNIKELFPPHIADQTMFALERALETNQLHAFEYGMPPGEEMQFFEARVSAVSAELAMIMVRDISQRKWIETEREKLIQELEDKNAELERFTYTVSHDLKSPLITIKGFLGFIEQDASNGNILRLKADIKRIGDATDKMQLLLNELLELSRIGRLKNVYEEISLGEIAHEAVELVQGRLLNAHAKVHIQKNMPRVHGDHPRLLEVLQNLIDNAAKFIGNQAKPKIEIGQKGEEDDKPIFFVRDNGIGIEAEHQDRIFGLFNKLDADTEGTGIGLTLVKRIVEVHGGRIWVESKPGKGSTFFFTLQTEPES